MPAPAIRVTREPKRRRHPPHRLVKIHRTYTVEEAALRLDVHKNTVRQWLKDGLETIDSSRPALICGRMLKQFLHKREAGRKRPSPPGHIFCFHCKEPRVPADNHVFYRPTTPTLGNLIGTCRECGTRLYQRSSLATKVRAVGKLTVTELQAQEHINRGDDPFCNCDFNRSVTT